MSQPLYFLPNRRRQDLLGLADEQRLELGVLDFFGLRFVWRDVRAEDLTVNEVTGKGPGGHAGLIVVANRTDGQVPRNLRFDPEHQDWRPVSPRAESLWIGIDKREPVTPADLVRRSTMPGYSVRLAGDEKWEVPIIRRPDDSTELPCEAYWDESNRFVETVREPYRRAWDDTAESLKWFLTPGAFDSKEFSKARALQLAIDALGINYRYDRWLHNRLRVIDTQTWAAVLGASVDLPRFQTVQALEQASPDPEAEQKKTSSAPPSPPSSPAGPPAASPATDRVAASSLSSA